MFRFRVLPALLSCTVLIAIGCAKRTESGPATSTAATSQTTPETTATTSAAPAATTAAPLSVATPAPAMGSGTYSLNPNLRADLLEVRRVSGGALLVKWRVIAAGDKPIYYDFGWGDIYYVDPAENKKYGYLTDSEGKGILDIWWGTLNPGEQRSNWAKFPAPPPTSTKISLTLPKFPPFEDVPVAQ